MSRIRKLFATTAIIISTFALLTPSRAQCIPDNFPDDWLQQQEIAGGHTIARHVGKTDQQLTNRLNGNRPPRAAGSYPASALPDPRYRAAQATIAQALANQRQAINQWANNADEGDTRPDAFQAAADIGRVARRQAPANVVNTRTFCTVLEANGDGTCYLLTSFPTPALQGYCN